MAKGASWLHLCMHVSQVTDDLQLKQEYDTIKKLHSLSGFGQDDANKCLMVSNDVWTDYSKVHIHICYSI